MRAKADCDFATQVDNDADKYLMVYRPHAKPINSCGWNGRRSRGDRPGHWAEM